MGKYLITMASFILLLLSCSYNGDFEADPLDPARGIDSQGDTILFSGEIRSKATGQPLPGVKISCENTSSYSYTVHWSTYSDSDGIYVFRETNIISFSDDISVTAYAAGYAPNSIVHTGRSSDDFKRYYNDNFDLDPVSTLPLLNGTYQSFSIDENQIAWFRFSFSSSATYSVSWIEDQGDIRVSAYVNDYNTVAFSNDYFSPGNVSVTGSGTIYIKVINTSYSGSAYFRIRVN